MRAIAQGRRLGVFAATKIDGGAGAGGIFQRNEARTFVAAIAKGLCFGSTAGAPVIVFTLFDSHRKGMLGGNDGFGHGGFLS